MDTYLQNLKKSTDLIDKLMKEPYDRENGSEVSGKVSEYTALLASTTFNVAQAEWIYNDAAMKVCEQYQNSPFSAAEKKMIHNGKLKDYLFFVKLTDRQNAAITHALDGLRSQLSYLKSEMQNMRN